MAAEHWVLVCESDAAGSRVPLGQRVDFDQTLLVGREGQLPLGVEVYDAGISRTAVSATPTAEGWLIKMLNRNGAVVHPWGLAPYRAQSVQLLRWPLIGIRVAGAEPDLQHWVLLESDDDLIGADGTSTQGQPMLTRRGAPPPPLAPAELSALQVVFEDYLAWPPPTKPPMPRQLKQVATRLGKSLSGVQDRLRSAQEKALRLGLPRPTTLTQPDYFHVLVAAGYISPSTERPFRLDHAARPIERTMPNATAGSPSSPSARVEPER